MNHNYHLQKAKKSIDTYEKCLVNYTKHRQQNEYVGQFYDNEGARANQFGLFGTSIYSIDAQSIENSEVRKLRGSCLDYLSDIVKKSNSKRQFKNGHIDEVKRIILKIAIVYDALAISPKYKSESNILLDRLQNSQKTDGSWGFFNNSEYGDLTPTSIVIRSIKDNTNSGEYVLGGINFILANFKNNHNLFQVLFALNSILLAKNVNTILSKKVDSNIRKLIKQTIRRINTRIKSDPTAFPNPPIADYNDDYGRTRFYRLPPNSIILLESLILLSDKQMSYLQSFTGKKIFDKSVDLLIQKNEFYKDFNGLRASTHSLHSTIETLELVFLKSENRLPKILKKLNGWIKNILVFGANVSTNLYILLGSLIACVTIYFFLEEFMAGISIFLGLSVKTTLDIISSIRNIAKN
jgi:hypothetical protein